MLRFIELRPARAEQAPLVLRPLRIPTADYENSAPRRSMIVEIRARTSGDSTLAISDPATCRAQRVVFSRYGSVGAITPDTALPVLSHPDPRLRRGEEAVGGCFAEAFFNPGERPGTRLVRAALVPATGFSSAEPPVVGHTRARSLPRFVLGAGVQRTTRRSSAPA